MTKAPPACAFTVTSAEADAVSSDDTTMLVLTAKWSLCQLARIYRLAKPMQKVTSAWTSISTTIVHHRDDSDAEMNIRVAIRVVFIPMYDFSRSKAVQEEEQKQQQQEEDEGRNGAERKPSSAVVFEMKITQILEGANESTAAGLVEEVAIGAQDLPHVALAFASASSSSSPSSVAAAPSAAAPRQTFSSETMGVSDGGVDAAEGTCFVSMPLPAAVLSKSRILEQPQQPHQAAESATAVAAMTISDATILTFDVAISVPLPPASALFPSAVVASSTLSKEDIINNNIINSAIANANTKTENKDDEDHGQNHHRESSVQSSIMQGVLDTVVGGFWSSASAVVAAAAAGSSTSVTASTTLKQREEHPPQQQQQQDFSSVASPPPKTPPSTATVDVGELLPRPDPPSPASFSPLVAVPSTSNTLQPPAITTTTTTTTAAAQTKKQQQCASSPSSPLPAALSSAMQTADMALHRWLRWCASAEGTGEEEEEGAAECLAMFDRVVEALRYLFDCGSEDEKQQQSDNTARNNNNNSSSSSAKRKADDRHKKLFLASTMMLSSFSAAVAMPPFTTASSSLASASSSDLRDTVLRKRNSLTPAPTTTGTKSSSTFSSSSSSFARQLASAEEIGVARQRKTENATTPTTTTKDYATSSSSAATLSTANFSTLGNSSSSSTSSSRKNKEPPSLRNHCSVLADFILTVANLVAIRVEHGALYRPLLRAEGWARWIHAMDKLLMLRLEEGDGHATSATYPSSSTDIKASSSIAIGPLLSHSSSFSPSPQRSNHEAVAALSSLLFSQVDAVLLSALSDPQRRVLDSGAKVAPTLEKVAARIEARQQQQYRIATSEAVSSQVSNSDDGDRGDNKRSSNKNQQQDDSNHHDDNNNGDDDDDDDEAVFSLVLDTRALQTEKSFRDFWGLSSIDESAGVNSTVFPVETNLRLSTHLLEQRCLLLPATLFASSPPSSATKLQQKQQQQLLERANHDDDPLRIATQTDALLDALSDVANSLSLIAPQLLVSAVKSGNNSSSGNASSSSSSSSFDEEEADAINTAIEAFEAVRQKARAALLPIQQALEKSAVEETEELKWGPRLLAMLQEDGDEEKQRDDRQETAGGDAGGGRRKDKQDGFRCGRAAVTATGILNRVAMILA